MTSTLPPRARRADRPAPDWELVYRRNSIERLKRDHPGLDVRNELPGLIERGYEDIPEEEVVRLQHISEQVRQELVGRLYPQESLDRVLALRDAYRQKQQKD